MTGSDKLTRDEAGERARLLSGVAYDVDLDLTATAGEFPSRTVVRFRCSAPGSSTFVDLDAVTLRSAELNGVALPSGAFQGARLALADLAEDNVLVVEADCGYSSAGVGLHRFTDPVDGRVYCHTQFEPFDAHRVYACFDQPDLKAPFTLTVRTPAGWDAISNGAAVDRPAGDGGRWRFATTPPIPTYIAALVTGPFHAVRDHHRGVDLGVFCRQSLAGHLDADEILEITRQGLDFFTEQFAYDYPFGKYDQLLVPEFSAGAMENPGCVTFNERHLFRSKVTEAVRLDRAGTILHEMAHMWFGDLVTMRWWDDLWLNESFATYAATLALAEATRFTDAWVSFAYEIKAEAYREDQLPTTHPISSDSADTDDVLTNFDGITYEKGASVLKQLVAWVGPDAFRDGLRDYFRRHEFGSAELGDFLAALERSSGRRLRGWSDEWLQAPGVATFRADLAVEDGRYAGVALVQEAPQAHPTLRAHRMAVGLYDLRDGALTRRRRVERDADGSRTDVPELVGEPVADLLLPNDDDLTYAKIRFDERSLGTVTDHLGRITEPLARAMCWGALWDMTRDAELPARRWVRLVGDHAAAESDVGVLQALLAQTAAAVDLYADPGARAELRAGLAALAGDELDRSSPGSDQQLVWARCLASASDDAAFAGGLLDGAVGVEGLAVDTDLRWFLLLRLAAAGESEEGAVAAELERDPTDIGARRAAAVRAARPLPAAKAEAWARVLDDPALPLATRRAILGGFWRAGQDDVLDPYARDWADAVARVWAERGTEEALTLTGDLYPRPVVSDAVVAAADLALAAADLPAPGRRKIVELRDDTLRALRARDADRSDGGSEG